MILVFSSSEDVHVHAVAAHWDRAGVPWRLLDLSDLPERAALTSASPDGALTWTSERTGRLDLDRATAAWWRRPQGVRVAPGMLPSHAAFATNECDQAVQGMLLSLPVAWMNHPSRDLEGHRKLWQLRIARACGLLVPETLITNDPAEALAFVQRLGVREVVYKPFQGMETLWRETRRLRPEELDLLATVRHAPLILQQYVPSVMDVRVTVVGDAIFAAGIHLDGASYPSDFRMSYGSIRYSVVRPPDSVAAAIRALMRRMGLVYGALDFRVDLEGAWRFLEVNPAGQWRFVEEATGQPISAGVAAWLAAPEGARAESVTPVNTAPRLAP